MFRWVVDESSVIARVEVQIKQWRCIYAQSRLWTKGELWTKRWKNQNPHEAVYKEWDKTKPCGLGCMFICKRGGYFGVDRTRTAADLGEGNRERSGPILSTETSSAESGMSYRQQTVHCLPHRHKNGEERRASRVDALDHLLVPAWAQKEAPENDAKIFCITELSVTSCTDRTSHTVLSDRQIIAVRSSPSERFMMRIQGPWFVTGLLGCWRSARGRF
jgi:hypothetical protein